MNRWIGLLGFWIFLLITEISGATIALSFSTAIPNIDQGLTNYNAGYISITANKRGGYLIAIKDRNNSKFIRSGTTGTNAYDFVPFTYSLQQDPAGTFGCVPAQPITNLTLSTVVKKLSFTQSKGVNTSGKYFFLITSAPKSLWYGTFSDTITVTITDY